jgi:hypothetical protein
MDRRTASGSNQLFNFFVGQAGERAKGAGRWTEEQLLVIISCLFSSQVKQEKERKEREDGQKNSFWFQSAVCSLCRSNRRRSERSGKMDGRTVPRSNQLFVLSVG